ncbi:MAG: hypothetical protein AB8B72_14795 [Crocinitomicaceae bacterium]
MKTSKQSYLALFFFMFCFKALAQNEVELQVIVVGKDHDSLVRTPFAMASVSTNDTVFYARAGIDGVAIFDCVKPGSYAVQAWHPMYGDSLIDSVLVFSDSLNTCDILLKDPALFTSCGGLYYHEPHTFLPDFKELSLSRFDQVVNGLGLYKDLEIDQTVVKSRFEETVVFIIDGVRYENIDNLPLYRIQSAKQFINGLPAKYGDTTSEVYNIYTKSYFDYYFEWKASQ